MHIPVVILAHPTPWGYYKALGRAFVALTYRPIYQRERKGFVMIID